MPPDIARSLEKVQTTLADIPDPNATTGTVAVEMAFQAPFIRKYLSTFVTTPGRDDDNTRFFFRPFFASRLIHCSLLKMRIEVL
jgi:hypothetical protein